MAALTTLAIVGPTASGKTALALELAKRLDAELVSADSRQMYKRLDAGTDKPAGRWEGGICRVEGVPYHLIDILDPAESTDAGDFAARAERAFVLVASRGRRAILVGGTGLYVRAALGGLDKLPRRDEAVREALAEQAEARGPEWLHEELSRVDPAAARQIPPRNIHRVVRALEVHRLTGRPISSFWSNPETAPAVYFGVAWPRVELEERIRRRCEAMLPAMIEEVRRLVPAEYTGREPGFTSIGYPEAMMCAAGEVSLDEALKRFIQATKLYAKRQATWFRRQAPVRWLPSGAGDARVWADEALALLGAA